MWDGFSDVERWSALSSGVKVPDAGPNDISQVIAQGPETVAEGESVRITIAILSAESLEELETTAENAASIWSSIREQQNKLPVSDLKKAPASFMNIRNTGSSISVSGSLSRPQTAGFAVYDTRGRLISEIPPKALNRGEFNFEWRPESAGTYIYRITAGTMVRSGKAVLR
jgi:hypothetical protein